MRLPKLPGQFFLWIAILILGASSAVTRKLTEIGAAHFMGGHNPISLCNVLFVGNLCALIVLLALHGRSFNRATFKALSSQERLALILVAILSGALAPALIFQALSLTEVNTVVLVGRLEPPLAIALSVWLLAERVNRWEVTGAIAAFFGVVITVVLQPSSAQTMQMGHVSFGSGALLAATGAAILAVSTIVGKKYLGQVPLGFYSIVRTGLGTVIFFFLALILYGHDHFMEAFSPFLWRWMILYGLVIVVVGQSFWSTGLRASSVSGAALVASFAPIAGILAAYLILGEVPSKAQILGGSMILVGIILSQLGLMKKTSRLQLMDSSTTAEQMIETRMGFSGV
jgi:drug/metabolite transporter (DMT)-like permease